MNIFDTIANEYDNEERRGLARIITKALSERLSSSSNKTAIDYGAGTGLVTLPLSSRFQELILIDASKNMIDVVNNKIKALKCNNVKTLVADFSTDEPNVPAVDVIFLSLTLLHVENPENLLLTLRKVLKSHGSIYIVDFNKNENVSHPKVHNGFSQTEICELMQKTGFKDTRIETIYHGEKIFMGQDASLFLLEAK